jgi:hypothetical protein
MKPKHLFLILLIILNAVVHAQQDETPPHLVSMHHLLSFYHQRPYLENLQRGFPEPGPMQGDLIVGAADPDEVVTITGDYYLHGDILIVNNGILNLDDADFQMDGDIFIMGHGRLNVTGGHFTVIQEYIYEHNGIVIENGRLWFSDMDFHSSHQSWSIGLTDSAEYIIENTRIRDGFITTGLMASSRATITNTDTSGEFLCFGRNSLDFQDSDFLLMWMVLPDSSVVDAVLPGDSPLMDFHFSAEESGIEHIPYSVFIDNCTNVNWGLISMSGSDATFRDTDFRAVGLMFTDPDSIVVSGLTNGSFHNNDLVDVPDRNLRLINSEVFTWNLYASMTSNVTVSNCVFGELLSQNNARAFITNSVCDGTGGYVGAFNESFLIIAGSLIKTQLISRDAALLVSASSALLGPEINADETSIMFLANTTRIAEPRAHASAVLLEGYLPLIQGTAGNLIPIPGTARLLTGPENPIPFAGYSVKYAENLEVPVWYATDGFHPYPIVNDTLAWWNTSRLDPGNYGLQLTLFLGETDSISTETYARLDAVTSVKEDQSGLLESYVLEQNFPNPFNASTAIRFYLPGTEHVTLRVLDILGREVEVLLDREMERGEHSVTFHRPDLPSGMYILRMETAGFVQTRMMELVR